MIGAVDPTTPRPRAPGWRWPRILGLVLLLGLGGVLTLAFVTSPPAPNGLGLLPTTETLLARSGVQLASPSGHARVTASQAGQTALAGQTQTVVVRIVLATAQGLPGSRLGPHRRLCWVVFLSPNQGPLGEPPAPGQIDLDTVLVDAHSGSFVAGFIAFHGPTPHSQVGTE